ncbi:hypothetical protein KSF_095610 [Reticulibacter mediterranei]|uniref:DUF5348 domain-containing protein n=1 Tax=Reticulibacter mediterranei TaxID=2778369 RepID=A0A8J3ISB2_9CHLR|nr:DUF5348 domain-containing protein [Reticulibacter mediterranei]GHO99513.1 hypothetical protein KSF_095610 [Reticulibacter mediterranei]
MEGTLMLSTGTRGRYALQVDGEEYGDLSSGQGVAIKCGNQWIIGCIEYDHDEIYTLLGPQTLEEVAKLRNAPRAIGGYYVAVDGGGIMGLCAGMTVRLL